MWEKWTAWIGPFLTVLAVGALLTVNALFDTFDWKQIGWVALLFAISAVIAVVIVFLTKRQQLVGDEETVRDELQKLEASIKRLHQECQEFIEQTKTCQCCVQSLESSTRIMQEVLEAEFAKTIIDYDALREIEASVQRDGEIWVLTSALELEDTELPEVIRANFRKNVTYTYMIADDPFLQAKMKKLALEWQRECELSKEQAEERIKCYVVPKHFAYMTVIIYNPYQPQPTVLVKFPTSRLYEKKKYPYIYKVDAEPKEAWQVFRNSFQQLLADKPECPLTKQLPLNFDQNPHEKVR